MYHLVHGVVRCGEDDHRFRPRGVPGGPGYSRLWAGWGQHQVSSVVLPRGLALNLFSSHADVYVGQVFTYITHWKSYHSFHRSNSK
jgi:hypothetical protein